MSKPDPNKFPILLDIPSLNAALGFNNYASALANIIQTSEPNFTMGIFGSWGSGKTTLMNLIREELAGVNVIPVDFSAWRYEKEEHLIIPLLDTVREALIDHSRLRRSKKIASIAWKTAVTIGQVVTALTAGIKAEVGVPEIGKISFDVSKTLDKARQFEEDTQKAKEALTPKSLYYGCFKALTEAFKEFLSSAPKARIVVFVDDLDRCLPKGALEVFESMKLFFDLQGFIFVVGLDRAIVELAVEWKYRELNSFVGSSEHEERVVKGDSYIEKIFQLPFKLPPVDTVQLEDFLMAVKADAGIEDKQWNEMLSIVKPHLTYLVEERGVNPREVKRYINLYTLQRQIKPQLTDLDTMLALQLVAFRPDWRIINDGILTYRDTYIEALKLQLGGDIAAFADLDPDIPPAPLSFLNYISQQEPGAALLVQNNLPEYISAVEETLVSRSPTVLLEAQRNIAELRKSLSDMPFTLKADSKDSLLSNFSNLTSQISDITGASGDEMRRNIRTLIEQISQFDPNDALPEEQIKEIRTEWLETLQGVSRNLAIVIRSARSRSPEQHTF